MSQHPGYVPRFKPNKDCVVSYHVWTCKDCGHLNGLADLLPLPIVEDAPMACEACGHSFPFKDTVRKDFPLNRYIEYKPTEPIKKLFNGTGKRRL